MEIEFELASERRLTDDQLARIAQNQHRLKWLGNDGTVRVQGDPSKYRLPFPATVTRRRNGATVRHPSPIPYD